MQPLVMITNGGDHPAEKWANVTAEIIAMLISDDPTDAIKTRAKDRFRLDVADLLQPHHERNATFEKGKLDSLGDARLTRDYSQYDKKAEVVDAIVKAAAGTPFADAFAKESSKEILGGIIDKHFAHVKANARGWHADKHPHGKNAKALVAAKAGDAGEPASAPGDAS